MKWDTVITYWFNWCMGLIATGLCATWSWLRKKSKEQKELKTALRALLNSNLYQTCTAAIAHGSVTVAELSNLEEVHAACSALGENSVANELYKRVYKLPLREE